MDENKIVDNVNTILYYNNMQILTLDNQPFDLDHLPEEVDDSMRFAVLDNSNPNEPDFFFQPLIFLESFNAPALVLRIGQRLRFDYDRGHGVNGRLAGSGGRPRGRGSFDPYLAMAV